MVKKYVVRLTGEERKRLKAVVSKGRASAQKIRHATPGTHQVLTWTGSSRLETRESTSSGSTLKLRTDTTLADSSSSAEYVVAIV